MKLSRWLLLPIVLAVLAGAGWFLYPVVADGLENWEQVLVACTAAATMIAVGARLTLGRGVLAGASQYDKLSVWAALIMSVVSAVTTSTGLLLLLTAHQQTTNIMPVSLAIGLGIGIQLSMLIKALRIGESIQQLAPRTTDDDRADRQSQDEPDGARWRTLISHVAIVVLLVLGTAVAAGGSSTDLLGFAQRIVSPQSDASGPNPLGLALVLIGLVWLFREGMLPRRATVAGLLVSLIVYLGMLTLSSGFGYMTYFISAQSEEVMAIDRDSHIASETPALVRRIRDAAEADVLETLVRARSGEAYDTLSASIDELAELYVENEGRMAAIRQNYENRRAEIVDARQRAAQDIDDARDAVQQAERELQDAQRVLQTEQEERDRRMPVLLADLATAQAGRDNSAAGRDESGLTGCGPICRGFETQVARITADIDALHAAVQEAQAEVDRLQDKVEEAELEVQATQERGGLPDVETPLPPEIVSRESFTGPRDAYNVDPTMENLAAISTTCSAGVQMLITAGLDRDDLPECDVSRVQADLQSYERAAQALQEVGPACARTDEEVRLENAAQLEQRQANFNAIPEYLQARLAWVSRCLVAANTGSPKMEEVVADVNRLRSEYTNPGYDPRRIFGALRDGNGFAIFALLMAIVVDTAILFAGISANAQRGRDLREDHRLVPADRLADRIRKTLAFIDPKDPAGAAVHILMLADLRPANAETADDDVDIFSHEILTDVLQPADTIPLKMIMAAASREYAKFVTDEGRRYWRLHRNLITLLTEIAAGASDAARERLRAGVGLLEAPQGDTPGPASRGSGAWTRRLGPIAPSGGGAVAMPPDFGIGPTRWTRPASPSTPTPTPMRGIGPKSR